MKCHIQFFRKNKKNIKKLLSSESAHRAVSINVNVEIINKSMSGSPSYLHP